MRCKRCLNNDLNLFYLGSKGYYCLKCIKFRRLIIGEDLETKDYCLGHDIADYQISFNLTIPQQKCINEILVYLKEKHHVMLRAVCGAGKTEMLTPIIATYLKQGYKVGFAIPRREVVIELTQRFQKYFHKTKVVKVCEGYLDDLYGDLIICTTHQLYRYHQYFDLLIIDEVDAFPFKGNDVLQNIASNASKKQIIYSSATIDHYIKKILKKANFKIVSLWFRPNLKPMIVPKIRLIPLFFKYLYLYYFLQYKTKYCLVFASSIKQVTYLYKLFKFLKFNCDYITSKSENKAQILQQFRNKQISVLFTTTILERGVTFKEVDVVIFDGENEIFDLSSLIQIAGRVGRDFYNPLGKCLFMAGGLTSDLFKAIKNIKYANKELKRYLQDNMS